VDCASAIASQTRWRWPPESSVHYAVWPWARAALGDSKPTVLHTDDGFDFEAIAELRPDLIMGVSSGMTEGDYDKLSRLAPTIAHPGVALCTSLHGTTRSS
jgi:ABC-type Fe3+-hydroxamate transport system substrate-binding protein